MNEGFEETTIEQLQEKLKSLKEDYFKNATQLGEAVMVVELYKEKEAKIKEIMKAINNSYEQTQDLLDARNNKED